MVLLAALVSLIVATAAFLPHHDGDSPNCLVCKVRSQPLPELTRAAGLQAPLARSYLAPTLEVSDLRAPVSDSASPRAPPA